MLASRSKNFITSSFCQLKNKISFAQWKLIENYKKISGQVFIRPKMRRLKHFGCTERFLFFPTNSCGFSLPDSRFCGNDELKIILRSRDWIPAFAGMTAAGCCFLFINFCNFGFQPSSINYRNVSIVIPAQAGIHPVRS
ncbi:TPA: hypothetical protein ACJL5V_000172, partial [Neisseria meningitidis]